MAKEQKNVNELVRPERVLELIGSNSKLNYWECRQILGIIGSFPVEKLDSLRKALKMLSMEVSLDQVLDSTAERMVDRVGLQLEHWKHGEPPEN